MLAWLVPLLALALHGCSVGPSPGARLLIANDVEAAEKALRLEALARPYDPVIQRNHAIALWRGDQREEAYTTIERAYELAPERLRTLWVLGQISEGTGRLQRALEAFSAYLEMSGRREAAVRKKVQVVGAALTRQSVREALARESTLTDAPASDSTLAVPPFANLSSDPRWDPLARGLAAVMITDLSRVRALRVVERARLGALQSELELAGRTASATSSIATWEPATSVTGLKQRLAALRRADGSPYYSGPIDGARDEAYLRAVRTFQGDRGLVVDGRAGPATQAAIDAAATETGTPERVVDAGTAPAYGALIGAGLFAQGAFAVTGTEGIQLDSHLVYRDGRHVSAGEPVPGEMRNVLTLEKRLLFQLVATLGLPLTDDERRLIEPPATESFDAFLAYSHGLLLEDEGRLVDALGAFGQALELDPDFALARDRVEIINADPVAYGAAVQRASLAEPAGGDVEGRGVRTAQQLGLGPPPDSEDADGSLAATRKVEPTVDVVVTGDLPRGTRP